MSLTRIKNTAIGDDGVTTQKLDDTTGGFTLPGTQFVRVPVGTTAQRPSGANGYLRFNTNSGVLEQWNANTSSILQLIVHLLLQLLHTLVVQLYSGSCWWRNDYCFWF